MDLDIILIIKPVFQHVELQNSYDAHDYLLHASLRLLEDLYRALLRYLHDALHELLALHRVNLTNPCEMLRRKGRYAPELELIRWHAERVSYGINPRIKDAYDISRIGLANHVPVIRHHLLWLREPHFLIPLHMPYIHTRREPAGAYPHESNPVPVSLVHICLNLKNKSGKRLLHRIDKSLIRHPGQRRGRHPKEILQEALHSEISKSRTKENRR